MTTQPPRFHECNFALMKVGVAFTRAFMRASFKYFLALLFGLPLLFGIVAAVVAPETTMPAMTPAQIAKKELDEKYLKNKVFGSVFIKDALMKSLRDPESLRVESYLTTEDGLTHCVTYRAKNGFGGYTKSAIASVSGELYDQQNAINKHCVGRTLFEFTPSWVLVQKSPTK